MNFVFCLKSYQSVSPFHLSNPRAINGNQNSNTMMKIERHKSKSSFGIQVSKNKSHNISFRFEIAHTIRR